MGGHILPKSAFPSEAEITEFRVLATRKLHHDKPATAPHFDFALKSADYRTAYWIHTLKGGGWRGVAKATAIYALMIYGVVTLWNSIAAHNDAVRAGLIGALIGLPLVRLTSQKRRQYLGPMRVHFGNEGLYLQDPANQARTSWTQFVGYLEGNGLFLLYHNPKLYRIIPKRALTGHAAQFEELVQNKLARFDYRSPNSALESKTAG